MLKKQFHAGSDRRYRNEGKFLTASVTFTAVVMHITKSSVYGGISVLTVKNAVVGLMIGLLLIVGSYPGKRVVDRVSERAFARLIDAVLVVVGAYFLVAG